METRIIMEPYNKVRGAFYDGLCGFFLGLLCAGISNPSASPVSVPQCVSQAVMLRLYEDCMQRHSSWDVSNCMADAEVAATSFVSRTSSTAACRR